MLVLLCSSASAAPVPPPLSTIFSLEVGPADAYALTDGGQLLAQTFGSLTSYDLGTGRMRWQTGQSSPTYRLRTGDGLVLMRPYMIGAGDPGTTAISVATGVARWRRSGNVVTVAGSSTLLAVTTPRPLAGPARQVQGRIDAVDPLTGGTRWSVDVPSRAIMVGVPGPADIGARMLLVHDDRTAALHDLDTGQLLTSAQLPAADYGPQNPVVAGGLILLRHPGQFGTEISAYDPSTLKQVWSESAEGAYSIAACGELACVTGPTGIRGVDPATGDQRWTRPRWQSIDQRGTMFIAYGEPDATNPIGVIDPDTGKVVIQLDGWRPVGGTGGADHLLVTRSVDAGARTMVAVAHLGDPRPNLLAELPAGTGDCQSVPSRLVCRSMYGELVVWAYRQKG
jgi:outer membrane protein assembly factor BamB